MLLVEIAGSVMVSANKLVQVFRARSADFLVQSDRQLGDLAVRLNFAAVLVLNGTGFFGAFFELDCTACGLSRFSDSSVFPPVESV